MYEFFCLNQLVAIPSPPTDTTKYTGVSNEVVTNYVTPILQNRQIVNTDTKRHDREGSKSMKTKAIKNQECCVSSGYIVKISCECVRKLAINSFGSKTLA